MKSKKIGFFFLILIIFLLFLKVDFRLQSLVYCCSDDSDYFMHTETIVEDFDFDYINQLGNNKNDRFVNGKSAPIGFPGSAFYSSPFMLVGKLLDNIFLNIFKIEIGVTNFKLFFYSISSIFYMLMSVILLIESNKILKFKINKIHFCIFFFGSGISYYAFERYSMTHVYEVFSVSILIYLSCKYYALVNKNHFLIIFISFFMVLGFYVKWVHFYIFLIPYIIKNLYFNQTYRKIYSTPTFLISILSFLYMALIISEKIYGKFTLNASQIYGKNLVTIAVQNTTDNISYLFSILKNFFIILVSQEFGLLWFQPILFTSTILLIFSFFNNIINKKFDKINLILIFTFAQVFIIQAMWESTGSSYGYRYLLNLTPLAIMVFYSYKELFNFVRIYKVLLYLSVFSILSTLFFETTIGTQLSLEKSLNSFGVMSRYTQKNYLSGYLQSFLSIDAYLKIFITSYLGIFILKPLIYLFTVESINSKLITLGLPVGNEKFQILIENLENISFTYFIVVFFTICYFVYKIFKITYIEY